LERSNQQCSTKPLALFTGDAALIGRRSTNRSRRNDSVPVLGGTMKFVVHIWRGPPVVSWWPLLRRLHAGSHSCGRDDT